MAHKPYTKAEFEKLVKRGEERLGLHNFIIPQGLVEPVKIETRVEHDPTCYCIELCLNVKLDALVAKTQQNLDDSKKAFSKTSAVEDVVWKD